jgi:type II secretory pathway component PulK
MTEAHKRHNGYVLLAVLWILVGIAGLAFAVGAAARGAIATSRNRMALTMAEWNAAGCLAQVHDMLAGMLRRQEREPTAGLRTTWSRLDRALDSSLAASAFPCRLSLHPAGGRLDLNATDSPTLAMVLRNAGMKSDQAESAAAVLVSRRPFVDLRQLHGLVELASLALPDSLLDVVTGPICINHAPAAVLAALPGFTETTVQELLDARRRGVLISGFHELTPLLSPDAPDAPAGLPGIVVLEPTAWVMVARATEGEPPVSVAVEVRVVRSEAGVSLTRRRSWLE